MSIQAARQEVASLTDFQKDLHTTRGPNEEIISDFYKKFVPSTWYSSMPIKLDCIPNGEETIYEVNNSFHFLLYTYMRFVIPSVSIRPKYKGKVRIAWCHNVGTNIVDKAVFKENDDVWQKWDSVWADIYFQFYKKEGAGKTTSHNIGIGNVPALEDWSESLPEYQINVKQPWFYSEDPALAFPIFYKGSKTRASHRYTFRRPIDLLRVQVLRNDKWVNVAKDHHKYVTISKTKTFQTPELWGRYTYNTDPELKWFKCDKSNKEFYIRDIEICDGSNVNLYNTSSNIDLTCTNPCLAMFWMAENRDASSFHNYSNYSTDVDDLYAGKDPIQTTSLNYGADVRIDRMSSDHFNVAECQNHFLSCPIEPGYHAYSYASDSTSFHSDIGVVLGGMNAKLTCSISNKSSLLVEDELEDEDEDVLEDNVAVEDVVTPGGPTFLTRVRLLVVKKITISSHDENYSFSVK